MTVEIYRRTSPTGKGKDKREKTEWLVFPNTPDEDQEAVATLTTLELAEILCKAMNWDYTINQ